MKIKMINNNSNVNSKRGNLLLIFPGLRFTQSEIMDSVRRLIKFKTQTPDRIKIITHSSNHNTFIRNWFDEK